ncbi:ABC transporter ATP-binding protein [Salipiger aestuarii]|uniref:Amino acid/amide ABC transporter ATP-binding protein 2 (HAAT family) n=1 Tax=Salipiger aestuarii TaxID=568098 RepID=A0A327YAS5_9RHOB|nr:ABC transporter ATP-binding protein [Salipiger aestuarii]KAA8607779.1 ABC transporter [Salipiger aestuarii]KAB2539187.1 ABC transporter [Salipiger aestuarii]RAK18170.1 amino acid/amide ABC transporter ATP-binding protein 2 (HAAT family) [Salipiger aestuarii]
MLSVERIHSYYGKAHILSDLTFEVRRGEVVALLGRNGAGKSTTMKSVMQLVRPRKGGVIFQGRDLVGEPAFRVAKWGIGYVPEDRRIFTDLTVLENLEVGRQPARTDAPHWTTDQLFDIFPNLAERRANRGKHMSGGEQQMLTIARTLMGNPALLLLDEPSEGIAPVIVEQMVATILKLKDQGLTVMISEQNLHFARAVADRAIIIEGGEKKFDGSFKDLEAHPEIRDAYLSV